jgi:hypothetical protein
MLEEMQIFILSFFYRPHMVFSYLKIYTKTYQGHIYLREFFIYFLKQGPPTPGFTKSESAKIAY